MLITPISFNSLTLNSANYQTTLLDPYSMPGAKISFIEQPEADASDADAYTVEVQTRVLSITVKNYASRVALIAALRKAFKRGTKSNLLAKFSDDGDNYIMPCRVINIVQDPDFGMTFYARLQSSATAWRAENLTTDTWTITGADNTSITVDGDDETRLIANLSFTSAPAAGYVSQAIYQLPNSDWSLGTRPWCIEMDTATVIGNGEMQADCDDLRVLINGLEARRWIVDANTANTKIWFNVTLNRGFRFTLKTAITDTNDITSIDLNFAADGNRDLSSMQNAGIIYHGTEWMAYEQPILQADGSILATITGRGVFDTTKQTHAVSDEFVYLQNVIVLQFGNPAAADPADADAYYDDTKPMIDLSQSDNTTWVWTGTTGFYDAARPGRTAQWYPNMNVSVRPSTPPTTEWYTAGLVNTGDKVMGMQFIGATQNGVAQTASASIVWRFDIGAPVVIDISAGGSIKCNSSAFRNAFLQCYSANYSLTSPNVPPVFTGSTLLWTATEPAADNQWDEVSKPSVTVPEGLNSGVTIMLSGQRNYSAPGEGDFAEIDSVTLTFEDVSPDAGLMTPKSNVTMDVTLKNDTNGDSLGAVYPLLTNKVISINSEESIVTYDGINFHRAIILNDETRPVFIRLQPGSNTISLAGAVGSGTVSLSWYVRRL